MQTVTILRVLWRHRLLSLIVVIAAMLAGVLVVYRVSLPATLESRKFDVGVSGARILVDTPASQVVDVAPKGSDTLGVRANLLANLMVDGELKTLIARRAGLTPDRLVGLSDTVTATPDPARKPDPRGWVLSTRVVTTSDGGWLPIIEVETQGPTAQGAAKLATAAVEGLDEYLDTKAAAEQVKDAKRLRISGLGVTPGRMAARGPRMLYALAASIVVALLGLSGIVGVAKLLSVFRATSPDPVRRTSAATDRADAAVALRRRRAAPAPAAAVPSDADEQRLREQAS